MRPFAHSLMVFPLFVVLSMGTRATFCEAAAHAGVNLHHHADSKAGCLADHSRDESDHESDHSDDRVPCTEECASDLTAAQAPKNPSVDSTDSTDPPSDRSARGTMPPREPREACGVVSSQPPDRLPALFSRSFTGRYLV
ncbi:MAG: hypothetical protein WD342_06910 [Verrucomicrobiales bacterium]